MRVALPITCVLVLSLACSCKSESAPAEQDRAGRIAAVATDRPADGGAKLVQALGDPDPSVRKAAVFALTSCLTEENRPAIVKATRDSDGQVRAGAVVTLSMYKDKEAAKRLGESLAGDAEPQVQMFAASGLGMNPSPEAVVALLENAEKHPSPNIRKMAMKQLVGKLGLRIWREMDPTSREWAGLVEHMKSQKLVQDSYLACGAALERRPQDAVTDSPEHGANQQRPSGATRGS
jgi:hypothetical protein